MNHDRLLLVGLLMVTLGLGYDLVLSKGGVLRLRDLQQQVAAQRSTNRQMEIRNAALAAEVQDLRGGSGALEERARSDLGMVRPGERWYRFVTPPARNLAPAGPPPTRTDATTGGRE